MKAVVTGGVGFIGHHLVNLLIDSGYDVEVWDNLSTGDISRLNVNATFKQIDLSVDDLPKLKCDVVVHLAATTSVQESIENPSKYKQHCFIATKRLLEWSLEVGVSKFLISSTAAVYGNPNSFPVTESDELSPMSPYAEWKLESEKLMKQYSDKIQCSVLRLFNVFGEGQPNSGSYAPAVALFMKQFKSGNPITVTGDGLQTRDYIYVGDVVTAFLKAIENQKSNYEIMNVGTGVELTILEIAKCVSPTGEIKHIEPRVEPRRSVANVTKIFNLLSWEYKTDVLSWILSKNFVY